MKIKTIIALSLSLIVLTTACGLDREVVSVTGVAGANGQDGVGTPGANGADGVAATSPGILCDVYDSQSFDRSNGLYTILASASPKFTKVIDQLDTGDTQSSLGYPKFTASEQAQVGFEDYALDCYGYIDVPMSGTYKLYLFSDDGSKLAINGNLLIDNDGLHSPAERSASTLLYKGPNKINVLYFQGPNTQIALDLDWSGPSFSRQQLPASKLSH